MPTRCSSWWRTSRRCRRGRRCRGFCSSAGLSESHEPNVSSDDLTHLDERGAARMVDVGDKEITDRTATAVGRLVVTPKVLELLVGDGIPKGDALGVVRIAGIMAAKRVPDLILLCHQIP